MIKIFPMVKRPDTIDWNSDSQIRSALKQLNLNFYKDSDILDERFDHTNLGDISVIFDSERDIYHIMNEPNLMEIRRMIKLMNL
jgi:hypothetical protein